MGHFSDRVSIKSMSTFFLVSSQLILAAWGKPMENGQSVVGREGVIIDCRTQHDSYFPDPDDCRFFYHCSDWTGLERKSCGSLYFHHQKRVCDWPYIVREIRPECPDERNLPPLPENKVVAVETTEKATFDDGSYIRFEPNPENKFRFPTPKPRRPVKNPVVFQESDFITNTLRPTLLIREHEPVRPSPEVQVVQLSVPPKVPTPSRAEAPRHLSFKSEKDVQFILVKKKEPQSPFSSGSTAWVSSTTEAPVTVVKTLPSRDIVKSLPTPQPISVPSFVQEQSTPTPAPVRKEIQNARRPLFDPASRPNILKKDRKKPISRTTTTTRSPVRTLPAHRYSPSLRPPIFTTERPKRNDLYCSGPRCFRPRKQDRGTFKIKASNGDDIETIFEQALDVEDADVVKRKSEIKKLLEAAKVENVHNSDLSDPEEFVSDNEEEAKLDSSTISSLKVPPSERNETYTTTPKPKVEIKSTLSPFRKANERPEFLEVIKLKAEEFKEKLLSEEVFAETTEISTQQEGSERIVVTVSKEVSTSIGTSKDNEVSGDREDITTEQAETIETTTQMTSSTMSTTNQPELISKLSSTESIAEEVKELFEDAQNPDDSLIIVRPSHFNHDLIESLGEVEETLIVVPSSQVRVSTEVATSTDLNKKNEMISLDEANEEDVDALQETRLHSTSVTTMDSVDDIEDVQATEIPTEEPTEVPPTFEPMIEKDKPNSVEMLTSVLDIFNVTALFEHLQQKPMAQKLQQVTPDSLGNLPEEQVSNQEVIFTEIESSEAPPPVGKIETVDPLEISEEENDETTIAATTLATSTELPTTIQPENLAPSSELVDIHVVLPAGHKTKQDVTTTEPITTFELGTSSSPIDSTEAETTTISLSEAELQETDEESTTSEATTISSVTENAVTILASTTLDSLNTEAPITVTASTVVSTTSTTITTTTTTTTTTTHTTTTTTIAETSEVPSFTSRRDQIRQRFLSKSRPSNTKSILDQLQQQQEKALEATRRENSFKAIEAAKSDEEPGSTSNASNPASTDKGDSVLSVHRDRLSNLRKQLFNRAPPTTTSPKPEGLPDTSSTKLTEDSRERRRSSPFFDRSDPSEAAESVVRPSFQAATSARQSVRCRVLKLAC
ncbi:hypothetical protein TCAL_08993 [Tigriopus californicus]|uniref:Chitin-binding type-2 domain-containing protein n=1 Tax=Tigriopus californicus TaxID=6832 RepID=A0A553PJ83_TIGCA|nr:mucin-2-like [Tigriopus californicus]TRY77747.1 hypothetical protein TCAL_08993 [Tigriopus californicus]|eukprot:TCALIF_08993-PA protein Name:"Protein of unknown function" AED:0.28 eAED:0.28 QI:110/1/0.5/1/1/1/2/0/1125